MDLKLFYFHVTKNSTIAFVHFPLCKKNSFHFYIISINISMYQEETFTWSNLNLDFHETLISKFMNILLFCFIFLQCCFSSFRPTFSRQE